MYRLARLIRQAGLKSVARRAEATAKNFSEDNVNATSKSKPSLSAREAFEDFKPYAQSVLVVGSAIASVWYLASLLSGLDGNLQKLETEMNERFKTTDEKIGKVAATTDEKIGKLRAEAELKSTENFIKYNNDENYASMRRRSPTIKDLKPDE